MIASLLNQELRPATATLAARSRLVQSEDLPGGAAEDGGLVTVGEDRRRADLFEQVAPLDLQRIRIEVGAVHDAVRAQRDREVLDELEGVAQRGLEQEVRPSLGDVEAL